jgi:hypothetical protein
LIKQRQLVAKHAAESFTDFANDGVLTIGDRLGGRLMAFGDALLQALKLRALDSFMVARRCECFRQLRDGAFNLI